MKAGAPEPMWRTLQKTIHKLADIVFLLWTTTPLPVTTARNDKMRAFRLTTTHRDCNTKSLLLFHSCEEIFTNNWRTTCNLATPPLYLQTSEGCSGKVLASCY